MIFCWVTWTVSFFPSFQVQPEVEDLDPSLLQESEVEKPEEKLGKLQYSLDYDFQSTQVGKTNTCPGSDSGRPIFVFLSA